MNRDAAERLIGHTLSGSAAGIAADRDMRTLVHERLGTHNRNHPGSSTKVCRVMFLDEPPSIDGHELSDKGTVNQAIALRRRASDVEYLYATEPGSSVIVLD